MRIGEMDPSELIARFEDDEVRMTMEQLDDLIVGALPGRRRVLWEGVFWGGTDQRIIGYGSIVQPRSTGEEIERFLVGLARQQRSYSLYVNAVEDRHYLGQRYRDRLGKVKVGAASIGFRHLAEVDLDVLREMLARAHELTPEDRGL